MASVFSKIARELYRDDVTEIEKVAGMFPRGFFSIVASEAGTGKTWLMLRTACELSVGGSILNGLENEAPARKVLIMSGETGAELLNIRLGKTSWSYNPKNIAVCNSLDMGIAGIPYLLNDPDGRTNFFEIVEEMKPDVIYFDSLISFHTADESKQGDMTDIYLYLSKIARKQNCAIVLNHHTRKRPTNGIARKFSQDDVIGSSAGVRMASSVYIVTQKDDDDTRIVKHVKAWDKKISPFSYTFTKDDSGFLDFDINLHLAPDYSLDRELASFLGGLEMGALLTTGQFADELGITSKKARYYLEKFATAGNFERVRFGNGMAYRLQKWQR